MKNLLCVAMMIHNDAPNVIRALASVIDYIDYIVILDTNEHDETLNIISYCRNKSKPIKIERERFINGSHNRNHLLQMCYGLCEFVLLLDPNEEAHEPDSLRRSLAQKRSSQKETGFYCRTYNQNINGIQGNDRIFFKVAVIRNNTDEIIYQYPVYEQLKCPSLTEDLCDNPFYLYQNQTKVDISVARQNITLLEQYLKENEPDTNVYYHLIEDSKITKNTDSLFKYCEKQLALHEKEKLVNYIYYEEYYHALLNLGFAYSEIGNDDFFKWMFKAYKYCSFVYDNPEPFMLIGKIYQQRNQLQLAYQYLKKACSIEEPKVFPKGTYYNPTIYRYNRWVALSEIAFKINKLEDYYLAKSHLN